VDLLVQVATDLDHQFQHQTHPVGENSHHLQLVVELELQELGLNKPMALAKEPAPLSSQYPQLFDLQEIQHHGFS